MPDVPYSAALANLKASLSGADFDRAKAVLDQKYGVSGQLGGGPTAPGSSPAPTPTLPTGGGAPPAGLPAGGGKPSPILEFANTLESVVQLARTKRNKSSVDLMAPYRGTVAASDFNGILNDLNTASDKTAESLVKKATDLSGVDIITATDDAGNVHGIDKNTGQVVWTAPGVGNKDNGSGAGGSGVLVRSGALTYTRGDYSDDASVLETSRGGDGWVDPSEYQRLYDNWVAAGGKIADFIKTFPPAQYVNPENDWLPVYLRPKKSSSDIPTSFPGGQ